ncbi:AmmeMemoRadiSam system protein B [Candidatus Uhrbacteria bacterium]|nr:AmmeMemoRadiSam system protein B [Candidatus Uhrbacteria bacterium]
MRRIVFILFAVVLVLLLHPKMNRSTESSTDPVQFFSDPVFTLEHIEGIDRVFKAVSALNIPETDRGEIIRSAVIPHHTLIADDIGSFWKTLVSQEQPPVIIIVGPAHQNQGRSLIQTTKGSWPTPFGTVTTQDMLVETLIQSGIASEEPRSFENEHSIGVHVPYIAKLFPKTQIIPIIAKSPANDVQALELVRTLTSILPKGTLLVSSIDFSHGRSVSESKEKDRQTLSLIETRSYEKINALDSSFLDSPFALSTFLLWVDEHEEQETLIWHEHSGSLESKPELDGTSYLTFFSHPKEETLTLTAVGDVMLSRTVATWLSQTTAQDACSEAKKNLDGSDIVFANLESVLSTSSVEIEKLIRFKADPKRVDVLHTLGITHVSVSNNHINDYGEAAWNESKDYLVTAGIEPIGGYRNDGQPVVTQIGKETIIFLAFETWNYSLDPSQVVTRVKEAAAQGTFVVVSFHWGIEYDHHQNSSQTLLAHEAIDAGADLILGHHPHVLQGIERYKDGLILYSLGNFIFDQFGEDENETLVARLSIVGNTRSLNLIPMRIEKGFPRLATEKETQTTLQRIASWSSPELSDTLLDGSVNW